MEKKNRYLIGWFLVLLIALFSVLGFSSAWGMPEDSDWGFSPRRHGRCFHHGMSGKNVTEFIMWRLEKGVKDLYLSNEQMVEFKDLETTIENRINQLIDSRKVMMDEFYKEINKEEPDLMILKKSMKEKINEMSGFMEENLDLLFVFYDNLDEDQKAKVLEGIRERFE
jgi:hypothetical protein